MTQPYPMTPPYLEGLELGGGGEARSPAPRWGINGAASATAAAVGAMPCFGCDHDGSIGMIGVTLPVRAQHGENTGKQEGNMGTAQAQHGHNVGFQAPISTRRSWHEGSRHPGLKAHCITAPTNQPTDQCNQATQPAQHNQQAHA